MTKRTTAVPKDFVVRHQIPEGMEVSLQGLGNLLVRYFGDEAMRRAGFGANDERQERRHGLADAE